MTEHSPDALATFLARKGQIDAILARLVETSADHFSRSPEAITWADAGDLGCYLQQLRVIEAQVFQTSAEQAA